MSRIFLSLTLLLVSFLSLSARGGASVPPDTVSSIVSEVRPALSRNVFLEFLGPSLGVGLGLDSRFRAGTPFGYRVGLSYTDGSFGDDYGGRDVDFKGVSFPLELNTILGKGKSKFEIGIGATPAILRRIDTRAYWTGDEETGGFWPSYTTTRGTKLNITGTINVGYRYQREEGFFLRVGLTAYIGDYDCSPIDGVFFLPALSLGYTFR